MSEHFNGLSPEEHERLSLLMEECGEVIHVIGKIMRHGYENNHPNGGPSNRELLEKELGDAGAARMIMQRHGDIKEGLVCWHRSNKLRNVEAYLHHTGAMPLKGDFCNRGRKGAGPGGE